jgi:hypothetical protein
MVKNLMLVVALVLCLAAGVMAHGTAKKPVHGGKVTVVITHEVKDYAEWRKVYDADEPNRKAGGFKVSGVYADANNPNMVTIIGEFPSVDAVNAFVSSPKLKEAMDASGVVGKPDVKILKAVKK